MQTVFTTNENITEYLDGIAFTILPRAFQDAIIVARKLGIRYLWIDALCIIQNPDDWAVESAKMTEVYQNANLVIAAAGASHPGEGCFSERIRFSKRVLVPRYREDRTVDGFFWLSLHDLENQFPSRGALQKRGWALQESYLARRLLSFMPGGLSWRCKELECVERSDTDLEMYLEWDCILQSYCSRHLTYSSDRLVALQGLAKAFLQKMGKQSDEYAYGHIQSELPAQLLWMVDDNWPGVRDLEDVPSWSWASRSGGKLFWTTEYLDDEAFIPLIKGADMKVSSGGVLQVKGFVRGCTASYARYDELERGELPRLAPISLEIVDGVPSLRLKCPSGEEDIGIGWADDRIAGQVYVLYLAKGIAAGGTLWLYGVLLLEMTPSRSYQRVGMGFISLAPASYDDNGVTAVIRVISIV